MLSAAVVETVENLQHSYLTTSMVALDAAELTTLPKTQNSIWKTAKLPANKTGKLKEGIYAKSVAPFSVGLTKLKSVLKKAPLETAVNAGAFGLEISIPTPDGEMERFKVWEAPIMEAGLARKFKGIKTYAGESLDNPTATIRFDVTSQGFHAQVIGAEQGTYYIDPMYVGKTTYFASYWRTDALRTEANLAYDLHLGEDDHEHEEGEEHEMEGGLLGGATLSSITEPQEISYGEVRRTYRLAVAATGEYTAAVGGGTVAGGQAAIVTAINRVVGVYERELNISMVLVANNSSLVYTNASTDPYNTNSPSGMLTQNQNTINSVIGTNNYDVGHVFYTGGGGLASLRAVGRSTKARGLTGLPNPVGDPFYIDYVAHELGHQFGANHTFNTAFDTGNRNGSTAFEPGSGSTIMGYAGLEGSDDLQSNSDPYFHSASIDEIRDYVTSTTIANDAGGVMDDVGTKTSTQNNAPTVSAGSSYVIPASTPFVLTATASDPDQNATLTYDWQQRDLGAATNLNSADNGSSPLFRAYSPTQSPSRSLPRLSTVLSGSNNTPGPSGATYPVERLPTMARSAFKWRVIVRDGLGGVATSDVTLSVVATGSGFAVTAPNSAVSWGSTTAQTVMWNVAGTTGSGINTANVKISLSTDGGNTFPYVLAESTPNDGSQVVTIPLFTSAISQARVKVEAIGNIFYDIGNTNFSIPAYAPPGIPALVAASDTGSSSSDRITKLNNSPGNTLTFTVGSTVSGETIRLFANGTEVGTAVATGTTTTITTTGSFTLPDGTVSFTATRSNSVGTSNPSTAQVVRIDTTPATLMVVSPTPAAQNPSVSSITLSYSEAVSGGSTSYTLSRDGVAVETTGTTVTGSGATRTVAGLAALTGETGVYELSVSATGLSDVAGNTFSGGATGSFAVNVITLPGDGANTVTITSGSSASSVKVHVDGAAGTSDYTWSFTAGQKLRIVGSGAEDHVKFDTQGTINAVPDLRLGDGQDSILVAGGETKLVSSPGNSVAIEVADGGSAVLSGAMELREISLLSGASMKLEATVAVGVLNIASAGSNAQANLDVGNATLIIRSGDEAQVRSYVRSWYQGGTFSGKGIKNALAGSGSGRDALATVAVRPNAGLFSDIAGFEVAATDVLVRYTYRGDSDLNGALGDSDYAALIGGVRGALTGWMWGDSNYDSVVDGKDFADFLTVRRLQGTPFT